MKSLRLIAILSLFLALPAAATFAASSNTVLVVVDGNSQVNRETYNFIRQNFSRNGLSYTVTASDVSTAKAGDYKAVVVVNSNRSSGTDPALDQFLKAYPNKKQVFLVNLYSGRTSTAVDTFTAANGSQGVDGVTAASTWRGAMEIHVQWVNDLIQFLRKACPDYFLRSLFYIIFITVKGHTEFLIIKHTEACSGITIPWLPYASWIEQIPPAFFQPQCCIRGIIKQPFIVIYSGNVCVPMKTNLKLIETLYLMRDGAYLEHLGEKQKDTDRKLRLCPDEANIRKLQGISQLLEELISEIESAATRYSEAIEKERAGDKPKSAAFF